MVKKSAGEDKWINKAGYYEQKEYPESTGLPKVVIIWRCSTSRFTDPPFFFRQEGRCGAQSSELAPEENLLEADETGNRSLLAMVNLTILRFLRRQLKSRFLPCSLAWHPGQAAWMSSAVWLNGRDSLRSLEETPGGVCKEAACLWSETLEDKCWARGCPEQQCKSQPVRPSSSWRIDAANFCLF